MNLTYHPSVTSQQRQWIADAVASLRIPLATAITGNVLVQSVVEPSAAGHDDVMATTAQGGGNYLIEVRIGLDTGAFPVPGSLQDFFIECFVHELVHVLVDQSVTTDVMTTALCAMMTRTGPVGGVGRTGTFADWVGATWQDSIQEGVAETVKDAATEVRLFDNRTNWSVREEQWPALAALVGLGGGGGLAWVDTFSSDDSAAYGPVAGSDPIAIANGKVTDGGSSFGGTLLADTGAMSGYRLVLHVDHRTTEGIIAELGAGYDNVAVVGAGLFGPDWVLVAGGGPVSVSAPPDDFWFVGTVATGGGVVSAALYSGDPDAGGALLSSTSGTSDPSVPAGSNYGAPASFAAQLGAGGSATELRLSGTPATLTYVPAVTVPTKYAWVNGASDSDRAKFDDFFGSLQRLPDITVESFDHTIEPGPYAVARAEGVNVRSLFDQVDAYVAAGGPEDGVRMAGGYHYVGTQHGGTQSRLNVSVGSLIAFLAGQDPTDPNTFLAGGVDHITVPYGANYGPTCPWWYVVSGSWGGPDGTNTTPRSNVDYREGQTFEGWYSGPTNTEWVGGEGNLSGSNSLGKVNYPSDYRPDYAFRKVTGTSPWAYGDVQVPTLPQKVWQVSGIVGSNAPAAELHGLVDNVVFLHVLFFQGYVIPAHYLPATSTPPPPFPYKPGAIEVHDGPTAAIRIG